MDLILSEPSVTYIRKTFESNQAAFHQFLPKSCGISNLMLKWISSQIEVFSALDLDRETKIYFTAVTEFRMYEEYANNSAQ